MEQNLGIYIHTFEKLDEEVKVKVKLSYYRPEQTQRVPGGLGSQIS
jgi:hypothetical protein